MRPFSVLCADPAWKFGDKLPGVGSQLQEDAVTRKMPAQKPGRSERSLHALKIYVQEEITRRAVAIAATDLDADHMREAADLLRTLVHDDTRDIERLSAWYARDLEKRRG